MGLWTLFTKGGWLMWPLLALGGVTIFIFVERFLAIRKASVLDMNFMNRIRDYISDGKINGILAPDASDADFGLAMSGTRKGGKAHG